MLFGMEYEATQQLHTCTYTTILEAYEHLHIPLVPMGVLEGLHCTCENLLYPLTLVYNVNRFFIFSLAVGRLLLLCMPRDGFAMKGCGDSAGNTHLKLNKFQEAVDSYGKAIDLDPTNATYFCNR